jgi:hypothetical protein
MPSILTSLELLDQAADLCAAHSRQGLPVLDFLKHEPDPMVRFAADLGRREGLFVAHERAQLQRRL